MLALAGCRQQEPVTTAHTPPLDMALLNRAIPQIAARLRPGRVGVGYMNMDSGESWTLAGDQRFPMQAVFMAPLASAVLAEADAHRLSLDDALTVQEMDLSPSSRIADAWPRSKRYTIRGLLTLAVQFSDNTAADMLMARIGGPGAVTAFLVSKRINGIRIDRFAREIQTELLGLAPFRSAWRTEAGFQAARASVPEAQRVRALTAYLSDPRDTATPRAMLHWLYALDIGELVAPASRVLLLKLMAAASPGGAMLIRAGLPAGCTLSHKMGAGPIEGGVISALNDVGVITLPDGRRYGLAVFISGAHGPVQRCETAIADIARAAVRASR